MCPRAPSNAGCVSVSDAAVKLGAVGPKPRPGAAAALGALIGLALAGCSTGPSSSEMRFAEVFWLPPSALTARIDVPAGLGVSGAPKLVTQLRTAPGAAPRSQSFTLIKAGQDGAGNPTHKLRSQDYRRFTKMQERVVASIGAQASVAVALQVPYCARRDQTAGRGAPQAQLLDGRDGDVLMSQPPAGDTRALQSSLPDCP